jgi:diguanylate cyclase (GGDEF)-like protein
VAEGQRDDRHAHRPFALASVGRELPSWIPGLVSTPLSVRIALSVLLLACVSLLDAATGFGIGFSVFYAVPAMFAGGLISRRAGCIMAVASAATWGYLDVVMRHAYSAGWMTVWNCAVRLAFFLIVNELVNRLRLADTREHELARTDSLTGIANARVFEERVNGVIAQVRRAARPFTITYLDVDRFKGVNDSFGHSEGDRLLRMVATTIERHLRVTDVVARLGGDEFGILMPETGAEQARQSLERIAGSLIHVLGERWEAGATFGAVTFDRPPDDVESAMRMADALMYRGKSEGCGRILQETWPRSSAVEG